MCGIVAALPSYDVQLLNRPDGPDVPVDVPSAAQLIDERDPVVLAVQLAGLNEAIEGCLPVLARAWSAVALMGDASALALTRQRADALIDALAKLDEAVDGSSAGWDADRTEAVQSALRTARDGAYAVRHDRLEPLIRIMTMAPAAALDSPVAVVGYLAIDRVLAAVDRLEVRGRDSAGVSIWIRLDAGDLARLEHIGLVRHDPLLQSGSVRFFPGGVAFVYKRAAVVGKLGENVARLRASITADLALHRVLHMPSARISVLAHTRWASVGRISEANAHPVDNSPATTLPPVLALAALNGDIDNHRQLRQANGLSGDDAVSTDAKLVPVRLAHHAQLHVPTAAMAAALGDFEGSMAIAAQLSQAPDRLVLAVKGSGQGLYIGLAEDGFMVASEVYGLVASTREYVRLDGGVRAGATAGGTVVELRQRGAGCLSALTRIDGDGADFPLAETAVRFADVTTRDLALGGATHYLEKEIGQAASAFRKTLRGRVRSVDGVLMVDLPDSSISAALRERLAAGQIRRVSVIGQGTAAVAAQGIAHVMESLFKNRLRVRATPATEFSAYDLESDLTDTLIVAISQSGSTTDTNRTVDLARARGAHIVAIINRRDSDLAAKSHGVLYTSDGRDVEMAVASTKAFYSQVAAGCLLALQLAKIIASVPFENEDALLQAMHEMPAQLRALHRSQHAIAEVARATAIRHQNWAVVGSGPNRVAAAEARIKLSELCYRTVSTDAVEDKKHIDLSAESLVLVCAAGTQPGQVRDLQKEVEIFAAHRNVPVVITDADESEHWSTPYLIRVPAAHPTLAWILSTAAAHLYSYHAAVAIDACADGLRLALGALEDDTDIGDQAPWRPEVHEQLTRFIDRVASGELVGLLSPRTLLALGAVAADTSSTEFYAPALLTDHASDPDSFLRQALTSAIDELTRSIDSVKHQAKTVTVGTSRDDADLYDNEIVRALNAAGCDPATTFSHAALTAMSKHAPLVTTVGGVTRYRLRGLAPREIIAVSSTGIATGLTSRLTCWSPLSGSKELVVRTRRPRLLRGASDGRLVLVLPEQEGAVLSGVAVVHIDLVKTADGARLAAALSTNTGRVDELRAAITEAGLAYDPARLEHLPVEDVLLAPVEIVARNLMLTA